jgi:two-component system NarL family sensor kinase
MSLNWFYNSPMTNKSAIETDTQKLRQRNRELFILSQIAQALNRQINLDEALQTALAQVAELFGLHTGWIFLRHEETGEFYMAAAQELPPALLQNNCRLMEGGCTCLDSYEEGGLDNRDRVHVIICSRLKDLLAGTDGLRYHASIPLYAQQKPLGVLNVASAESHWWVLSSDDLPLLHTVGDLLSIAIERARLFDQSTQLGIIEERNRLAREIHDTLAQGLTGISLKLEAVDAMLEMKLDPAKVRPTVQQALSLTRSNLDEARRSVLDLRAAPLEGRNLAEALQALTQDFGSKSHLSINLNVTGGSRPLPIRVEVGLYRIAQEALTNIIRHAQAQHIGLDLAITPEQIQLTIEDDGQGFDPRQIPENSFGLLGLNERVKLLAGQLHIESSPGQGVRVKVVIPLA